MLHTHTTTAVFSSRISTTASAIVVAVILVVCFCFFFSFWSSVCTDVTVVLLQWHMYKLMRTNSVSNCGNAMLLGLSCPVTSTNTSCGKNQHKQFQTLSASPVFIIAANFDFFCAFFTSLFLSLLCTTVTIEPNRFYRQIKCSYKILL